MSESVPQSGSLLVGQSVGQTHLPASQWAPCLQLTSRHRSGKKRKKNVTWYIIVITFVRVCVRIESTAISGVGDDDVLLLLASLDPQLALGVVGAAVGAADDALDERLPGQLVAGPGAAARADADADAATEAPVAGRRLTDGVQIAGHIGTAG